jgi:hypothetical protein
MSRHFNKLVEPNGSRRAGLEDDRRRPISNILTRAGLPASWHHSFDADALLLPRASWC